MSFIGKKVLSWISKPKSKISREQVSFNSASQIGVFYTYEDPTKITALEEFKQMIPEGKSIEFFSFNPSNEPVDSPHAIISYNELSNLGKFNSSEYEAFLAKAFDFLIVMDFTFHDVTKFTLANSKAKCRVGIHDESVTDYLELMIGIHQSAGFHNFAEQTIKYLKQVG